jgi:two-component system sensor histidine kinase KdpD
MRASSRAAGSRFRQSAISAFAASLGVALVTVLCYRLHANFAISSFIYLLVIVIESLLAGDFLSSLVVSFEAVVCLDYFFTDPLYTLAVDRGVDAVALLSFLTTALVITTLVSRLRAETESAHRRQGHLDRLYRLSQQLLAMKPEPPGTKFLEPFCGVFGITAVCMFDADTVELHMAGYSQEGLADRTRNAYVSGRDTDDRASGISVRRLQVEGRTTGAIGFEGVAEDAELISGPLATLAATLLERTRAVREAGEAAAAAQTEVYRSAVLDALAHEFKTPLATILAAAGGLREAGFLKPNQLELAEMIETEAARLGGLTSRLLRMVRLDREEVRPRMEIVDITSLLAQLMAQYTRRSSDRRICFCRPPEPLEVRADPELLRLAVSQLLENACKYSLPGSTVTIHAEEQMKRMVIRVSNNGSSIAARDQRRIFDRFYRGADASHLAPGSGLGLYVARKIAAAHGGTLDLDNQGQLDGDITFRFAIPSLEVEADHVVTTN